MTYVATVSVIGYSGARPVLMDVEPGAYDIDPAKSEAAVTVRTKPIVPVHPHGRCGDMDPIPEIAGRYGVLVIQVAAQVHGAEYRKSGTKC